MAITQDKDRYVMGEELGRGNNGKVYACRDTKDRRRKALACKVMSKKECWYMFDEDKDLEGINEIKIMQRLSTQYPRGHPHIVNLVCAFEDDKSVYLVMEQCKGGKTLSNLIRARARSRVNEKKALQIMRSLMSGIDACHAAGVMHGDIKLDNVLVVEKKNKITIKLCDFGFSTLDSEESFQDEACVSNVYMAPEVKADQRRPESDVWSAGICLYLLLGGKEPSPPNWADFSGAEWHLVSPEAKDVISGMLVADPNERMTIERFRQHPWLKKPTPRKRRARPVR